MSFSDLSLSPKLLRALSESGYNDPTPVQADAIPVALAGHDLIGSAATGTGKTAAFLLPALMRLEEVKPTPRGAPRVLVLTPTRELAQQVSQSARLYAKHMRVMQGVIVGGMPFGGQMRLLSQRIDLLVATPGRLMDHMERNSIRLDQVEMLILDEADRMLDMGFIHAVRQIAQECPKARQTLMFTATWDKRLAGLAAELMNDPKRIESTTADMPKPKIDQSVFFADDSSHKDRLMTEILARPTIKQAVIFAATKRRADRIAERLERSGQSVAALHGDMRQNQRDRTLADLKAGRLRLLVATDLAARGIDVPDLSLVINYDLPRVAEDYVHRIGRTGRNGATGTAVSLIGPDDRPLLKPIERLLGEPVPQQTIPGMEPRMPATSAAPRPNQQPRQNRRPPQHARSAKGEAPRRQRA